jgi:hypothetical protein
MHDIEMQEMSQEFFDCWQSAGNHLNNQVQGGIRTWLRAHPNPPFLEHLSFCFGNQLFFIRIEDVDGKVRGPGSVHGLLAVAEGNCGHPCLLPMRRKPFGGAWIAVENGWGLIDAITGRPVDPVSMVTEERIEMTPWEIHDMAVQVVRGYLHDRGYQLMSWQGNPEVDPAIWFLGDSKGPEWVVVRAVRFPESHASRPANWRSISSQCARLSQVGHFASVAIVSAEQPFASPHEDPVPLWRGHGMQVRFDRLE